MNDPLVIAGKAYNSRLLVGTGKYKDFAETREAIDASGAEIVTVANCCRERTAPSMNADVTVLTDGERVEACEEGVIRPRTTMNVTAPIR